MEKSISKIEVKPTGSYFEVDSDGYIVNTASREKIQEEWKPVVEDIIDAYKRLYGEHLKHVYIRGSVAKGEAVKGVSDIDAFAYVDMARETVRKLSTREMREEIEQKYSFLVEVEMGVYPLTDAQNHPIILNQSACVYGEPFDVPRLKPGRYMAIHAPGFHKRLAWFEKFLSDESRSQEGIEKDCVWLMKGLLRAGFELTMEREHTYTRDVYRCYEMFAKYYPEKEQEMREVLDLVLNPTSDKEKMKRIMDTLGQWLRAEIPKHFELRKR